MKKRSAALPFIFTTILLDALGIGLMIPVMPDVIRRFGTDPSFVNRYFGLFISVYALMQFLASPVLGSLSDRFGRRPVLLVSLLGAGLDYLLMAFAPNMILLFIGRVISGLTGASMTVAASYMADISNDKTRAANFGMIGAAFGLGFIFGPGIGGLLSHYGASAPFVAAACLTLLNFAFGCFVLPESLPPESRRPLTMSRLNPLSSLKKVLRPSPALALIWVYFLINLGGQSHISIWTLYAEHRFGWTTFQVGLSLSAVGLAIGIVQGWLTRVVTPRFGEERTMRAGLCFYVSGFLMFAFANQGWMMYPILAYYAISGIAGPAMQSMISRGVPSSEQGELQGSLISLASLTSILAPLIYTNLFAIFAGPNPPFDFPGAPYFAAALICGLGLAIVLLRKGPAVETPQPT